MAFFPQSPSLALLSFFAFLLLLLPFSTPPLLSPLLHYLHSHTHPYTSLPVILLPLFPSAHFSLLLQSLLLTPLPSRPPLPLLFLLSLLPFLLHYPLPPPSDLISLLQYRLPPLSSLSSFPPPQPLSILHASSIFNFRRLILDLPHPLTPLYTAVNNLLHNIPYALLPHAERSPPALAALLLVYAFLPVPNTLPYHVLTTSIALLSLRQFSLFVTFSPIQNILSPLASVGQSLLSLIIVLHMDIVPHLLTGIVLGDKVNAAQLLQGVCELLAKGNGRVAEAFHAFVIGAITVGIVMAAKARCVNREIRFGKGAVYMR